MRIRSLAARLGMVAALLAATAVVPAVAEGLPSDNLIHDQVMRRLANDTSMNGGGLGVDVKYGVVTLSGRVEKQKQKEKAEKLAHKVAGVKAVVNNLTVGEPSAAGK